MKGELVSIQYLRAVAALMVVFFHIELQLTRMGYDGHYPRGLAGGVDIFFVISGFIMWMTTAGREVAPFAFYRRRFVRIVPLYWLLTSVIVAMTLTAPALLQSGRFDPLHVLASYFFIASPHPVQGTMEPVLIPGWTLNFEMFFYLLFGAALVLPARLRLVAVPLALAALVALGRLVEADSQTILGFYTSSVLLEFALGMAIAAWFADGRRLPRGTGWLMLVAGFAAMLLLGSLAEGLDRLAIMGVPAALIVLGALSIEREGNLPALAGLRALGDASYALYLSHGMVLAALALVWRRTGIDALSGGLALFVLAAMAASCLASLFLHRAVEMPLIQLFGARHPARRDRRLA